MKQGAGAPSLADLIDLELRLRRDAELAPEELHERDGAIGGRIRAREQSDRAAVLAWLGELRGDDSPGRRALRRRDQVAAMLGLVGFALGAVSVAGWLATSSREPVNVVYFWPVFVGSQLLLALLFWLTILPASAFARIPPLAALHALLRAASGALPRLFARLQSRFASARAEAFGQAIAELRRLDWLYGRVRFWALLELTQVFGVAFNVGAIAALLVVPTIDDPAFGWRSRLLDERQVAIATRMVATPWQAVLPEALPSPPEISATRYSSVAQRYADDEAQLQPPAARPGGRAWAAWWPFLLASVSVYGLLPRLVHLLWAGLALRRALASVSFERVELARLCERLRRPRVATTALEPELETGLPAEGDAALVAASRPRLVSARALRWTGVPLADDELSRRLAERFGAAPASSWRVGELGGESDEAALAALEVAPPGEAVYLVVEAWEPPVGDYVDFLSRLRRVAGAARPILVVLYNRAADGHTTAPEPRHAAVWLRRVARIGDPWLSVEPLVEAAPMESA